jgi:hypothetical protein
MGDVPKSKSGPTFSGQFGFPAWQPMTNAAPVITEGSFASVTLDEDGSPTPFSLTLHATDVDADILSWSVSTAALHGAATASGTGTSKVIGYTPAADYNGSDSFVVQVDDGLGAPIRCGQRDGQREERRPSIAFRCTNNCRGYGYFALRSGHQSLADPTSPRPWAALRLS